MIITWKIISEKNEIYVKSAVLFTLEALFDLKNMLHDKEGSKLLN